MALDNDKSRNNGRKFEETPANEIAPASTPAESLATALSNESAATGVDAAAGTPAAAKPTGGFPAKAGTSPSGAGEWIDIKDLGVSALIEWRTKIDRLLPPRTLAEVDLEGALLEQYHVANELMTKTLASGEEANKKAQTVNTCTAILQSVIKLQSELYNNERMKGLEIAIERAFKTLPMEIRRQFYEEYERAVTEVKAQSMSKAQRRDLGT